jgi:hypothetical protein
MLTEKRTLFFGSLMALVCAGIISGAVALEMRSKASATTVGATNSDASVITIPEETPLKITLDQGISSNVSRPGDHFQATLAEPVVLNDKVVVPQGTPVDGVVVDAVPSGHLRGRAQLQLALDSMQVDGKTYDLSTKKNYRGRSHKKHNWAWIGGGAGGGAVIGALAAGGKGALIGGPIGAGAGVAVAYFTGKRDIHLAPETHLQFRLSQPLTIDTKS